MLDEHKTNFLEKMSDDFNAPAGLATLQDLTRRVNALLNQGSPQTLGTLQAIDRLYRELGGEVLGIIPDVVEGGGSAEREAGLIRLLADLRSEARDNKAWATADKIRDDLKEMGVTLEDRPEGTFWKLD
jgi:cysteinyl-tRNA synthetase